MYQERNVSLSQFGLAILILYLIMRYVPHGREIGIGILILSLITTNKIGAGIAGLFSLIDSATALSDKILPYVIPIPNIIPINPEAQK